MQKSKYKRRSFNRADSDIVTFKMDGDSCRLISRFGKDFYWALSLSLRLVQTRFNSGDNDGVIMMVCDLLENADQIVVKEEVLISDEELDAESVDPVKICYKKLATLMLSELERVNMLDSEEQETDTLTDFCERVGMNVVENQIFKAALAFNRYPQLFNIFDSYEIIWDVDIIAEVLALALNIDIDEILTAFDSSALLIDCGLICFNEELLLTRALSAPKIFNRLLRGHVDVDSLCSHFCLSVPVKNNELLDFNYLGDNLDLYKTILAHAKSRHSEGVNILVYGKPGTGKTQLAYMISQELDMRLLSVANEGNKGALSPKDRLNAYRLTQQLYRKSPSLVLFDEVDDSIPSSRFNFSGEDSKRKQWLHQTLETNPNPTIWLCNDKSVFDEAELRRFTLVMEMPTPSIAVKKSMLNRRLDSFSLSEGWINGLAKNSELTPALIDKLSNLARVLTEQKPDIKSETLQRQMQLVFNNHLIANNKRPISQFADSNSINTEWLNTDFSITRLQKIVNDHRNARLCFYGLPGTGKSAFAKQIAEQCGREVLEVKASDLLDPYVGGTEKKIARMFKQATENDAVIIVDEIDTFLRDRSEASRNWEVSMVNEFLVGLERFSGLFIGTTNLLGNFDPAVIRRFDLKIEFRAMLTHQRIDMLRQLVGEDIGDELIAVVAGLNQLTPADFKLAEKQFRFDDAIEPAKFVQALVNEAKLKPETNKPIGFLRTHAA